MQYRRFGGLDWKASALGFGMMRLPTIDNDPGKIDEPEALHMVRYAIDHGVNYVDTAYPYHKGKSEEFVAKALKDGYREKVRLATKAPCWLIKSESDFDRYLDEQLERLQTEIDFYLLHALDQESWERMQELGALGWAERAIADGRFKHLGFSFHDSYEIFEQIVDAYDGWTFCQIQYNYMDIEHQAGARGLHHAADKGLAVVIMEPLRGGQLTKRIPGPISDLWAKAKKERTPADWGLQWLWDQPQVSLVLSGMSAMQHVEENLASAAASAPGSLTEEERNLVKRVQEMYQELSPIPCTDCKYCMPCPSGVNIPRVLAIYNQAFMYEDQQGAINSYGWLEEGERAHQCTECLECEGVCPQHIPITEWLKKADTSLRNTS